MTPLKEPIFLSMKNILIIQSTFFHSKEYLV